jgi:hypothetical protein
MSVQWNKQVTATLLAALRFWQATLVDGRSPGESPDGISGDVPPEAAQHEAARRLMPEQFNGVPPLVSWEIDRLCEALNFDDGDRGRLDGALEKSDRRTTGTLLAALRFWRREVELNWRLPEEFPELKGLRPLGDDELVELIASIGFGAAVPETTWSHKRIGAWLRDNLKRPDEMTWRKLLDFIHQAGFARDEYFSWSFDYDLGPGGDALKDQPVWMDARWLSAWWCVGGSEGYYVHVERIYGVGPQPADAMDRRVERQLVLLGKFWDAGRAEEAANAIQWLVNRLW